MGNDADISARFGRNLREIRNRRALSQERLGELAGLDRTYVSSAEAGRRNATLATIARLAKALDVEPAELLIGPQNLR